MAGNIRAIPPGFHTLTPHLIVRNADEAIEFYKKALGAEVLSVARMDDNRIMHAALQIGDSILMLNDEMPEYGALSPLANGGSGVTIHVYTEDVDNAYNRAVSAGAKVKMPLMVARRASGVCYGRRDAQLATSDRSPVITAQPGSCDPCSYVTRAL